MITVTNDVTVQHILELEDQLRDEDRIELEAMGITRASLLGNLMETTECDPSTTYVALDADGKVIAMGGLTESILNQDFGIVWLLGTKLLPNHIKSVIKKLKPILKQLIDESDYHLYGNMVHKDNKVARRFIKHLGFTITEQKFGDSLDIFTMEKINV